MFALVSLQSRVSSRATRFSTALPPLRADFFPTAKSPHASPQAGPSKGLAPNLIGLLGRRVQVVVHVSDEHFEFAAEFNLDRFRDILADGPTSTPELPASAPAVPSTKKSVGGTADASIVMPEDEEWAILIRRLKPRDEVLVETRWTL
ncbi:hypothetical protein DFP72DRAFT_852186 [Ephemerocybe angulata]|uniref:Uncharacterized protein n=1 Tax=Ephemerocybe angulata TaxID=980116 RepID=A0A8H6M378_9AGAR|nr:hypothetical protein DFP72DRAFT_852186 [Tulosesus angulatus]